MFRRDHEGEDRFREFLGADREAGRPGEEPAGTRDGHARGPIDFARREDTLSALTLARTIAFLLYSLLVPLVTLGLMILTPLDRLSPDQKSIVAGCIFLGLEYLVFLGVIRGILPSPDPHNVAPFDERQMEIGVMALSFAPWLLRFDPPRFVIFQVVVNGFLCLGVVVFFVSKSMLSRRWRWGVLRVLLLPVIQLALLCWLR